MLGTFWRKSGLSARLAMVGLVISIIANGIAVIGGLFFLEPQPGEPPGAQPSNPVWTVIVIPVLVLAAQMLVVLGLRSRDAALQAIAVVVAGLGCLVLVGVSLGIGFEIAGGGAPVWLGPSTGVSVAAGLFYLAAIISWIRARVRGIPRVYGVREG